MNKLSLALGAASLLALGGITTAAHAGEHGVRAHLSIQLPSLVLPAQFEPPRPYHGVRVLPAPQPVYEDYRRHDGYQGYHGYHGGHRGYQDGPRWHGERQGHWERNDRGWGYRDRDGDGVPNRYDRRPDNPYRY